MKTFSEKEKKLNTSLQKLKDLNLILHTVHAYL